MELYTGLFQHAEYLGQSLVGRHAITLFKPLQVASAIPAAVANEEKIRAKKDRHKINEEGCEEDSSKEKQKVSKEIKCSISKEG
jgi:hypothetical protein